MKTVNFSFWKFLATVTVLSVCHLIAYAVPGSIYVGLAYADPSGGGTAVVSVAKIIHNAAKVETLARELDQVLSAYAVEREETSRNELLKKARNILAKLIEQANNVESEISIISNKQLDKVYSGKLDRVLAITLQQKTNFEKKMRTTDYSE